MKGLKKIYLLLIVFRKLMEDVLHQNKGVARKKDVQDIRSNIGQLQRTEGKGDCRMPLIYLR